jgi:uncharacterized membrane protein YfcA
LIVAGVSTLQIPPVALSLDIVVASLALFSFVDQRHMDWPLAVPFVVTSIPASFLGGSLNVTSQLVQWLHAFCLLGAGSALWFEVKRNSSISVNDGQRMVLSAGLGLGLGFLAGITGIGGGIFLAPAVILLGWATEKEAAAVAALFVLMNSIAGVSAHFLRGNFPVDYLIPLSVSVAIGGFIGSQFGAKKASPKLIRRVIGIILLVVSGRLLWNLTNLSTLIL